MRRGSLVGPLLIIAIGGLFLANTLQPELPIVDMLGRYWPFLLIIWGALRLVEVVAMTSRYGTAPAPGMRAGEWTLVVLVCLIGSGLYAANRFRPWQHLGVIAAKRVDMFGRSYDYAIAEQQVTAGKAPRILIENLRGNVRVIGADAPEVKVSGRKTIRALQESDAVTANQQSPVELTSQGEQIVIRTNQDRVSGEQNVSADLELTVPRAASIEGRGRRGDFEISDLNGDVEISSDNAGVRVQNITGRVRVDVRASDIVRAVNVKGAVEVNGGRGRDVELDTVAGDVVVNGFFSGDMQFRSLAKMLRVQDSRADLRVEKLPGSIHMDLSELSGTKLVGPVRFTSRSRDVNLTDFSQSAEIAVDRGDITLRPVELPLARMDVRTRSGQVDVALPENAKFQIKATTSHGEVSNDFNPALQTEFEGSSKRRGGTLTGAVGSGATITLATDRGSITLRKDTGTAEEASTSNLEQKLRTDAERTARDIERKARDIEKAAEKAERF